MQWFKKQAWFIYLFPLWAYFLGVKDYAAFTNTGQLLLQSFFFAIIVIVLYVFVRKLSKNPKSTPVVFLLALTAFTFFGNIKQGLFKLSPFLSSYKVLPFLILMLLVFVYFMLNKKNNAQRSFAFCNSLILILFAYQLVQFAYAKTTKSNKIIEPMSTQSFTNKPNIYLYLLDGYPGFEALDSLFGYDNSAHKSALENRGFYVHDTIRSNYNYTLAAMSSLFNMNYVQKENSTPVNDFTFMYRAQEKINESALAKTLVREKYTIRNLSIFPFANQKGYGDYIGYYTPLQLVDKNFFHNYLLNTLAQNKKTKHFPIVRNYVKKLDRYYYQNEKIVNDCIALGKDPSPNFTYVHLLLPHEPYLTDSAGNLWKDLSAIPEKEAFVHYSQYANKLMLKIADSITAHDSNAIQIFLSDHGYRGLTGEDKVYSYHNFLALKTPIRAIPIFKN